MNYFTMHENRLMVLFFFIVDLVSSFKNESSLKIDVVDQWGFMGSMPFQYDNKDVYRMKKERES